MRRKGPKNSRAGQSVEPHFPGAVPEDITPWSFGDSCPLPVDLPPAAEQPILEQSAAPPSPAPGIPPQMDGRGQISRGRSVREDRAPWPAAPPASKKIGLQPEIPPWFVLVREVENAAPGSDAPRRREACESVRRRPARLKACARCVPVRRAPKHRAEAALAAALGGEGRRRPGVQGPAPVADGPSKPACARPVRAAVALAESRPVAPPGRD